MSKILKKAQDGDDIPAAPSNTLAKPEIDIAPAPAKSLARPQAHSHQNYAPNAGNSAIKQMQQAIIDFANIAADSDITSMTGGNTGNQYATQTVNDLPSGQNPNVAINGTDAFGKFLVNNYVNPSAATGANYLNTDVSGQQNRADNSGDVNNLRNMINTMKHLGSPGKNGETTPDGIWKGRTDNALQDMAKMGLAIVGLAKDMNIKLTTFNEQSAKNLEQVASYSYTKTDDATKEQIAVKIIPVIKALGEAFKSFKQNILTNKKYLPLINQSAPIVSYDKANSIEPTTEDDTKLINNEYARVIEPFKDAKQNWALLSELKDKASFDGLMKRLGRDPANAAQAQQTLNEISAALGKK